MWWYGCGVDISQRNCRIFNDDVRMRKTSLLAIREARICEGSRKVTESRLNRLEVGCHIGVDV